MEDTSHEEVLKEEEFFKLECKFDRHDRWVRNHRDYESFEKAARSGSIHTNQDDVEDYRIIKVEKKETLVHP